MDEYSALAQRVAMTMDDVRGCLLLSRDGLVLGAFPEEGEAALKPAWLRFVHVGEARRSFIEFGDQIWAYIHRGAYAAFVVSGTGVRPGVLLDQLEQALLVADEARQNRDSLKVPEASGAPSGKPRTSLHPPADKPAADVTAGPSPEERAAWAGGKKQASAEPTVVAPSAGGADPLAATAEVSDTVDAGGGPAPFGANPFAEFADGVVEDDETADEAAAAPDEAAAAPDEAPATSFPRAPQKLAGEGEPGEQPAGEIDRVMLAKEFSGLLQLDSDGDEETS